MKKTIALIITLVITLSAALTGCGYKYKELNLRAKFDQSLKGTTLTVYNWGEYISNGEDDSMDTNKEFEKLTGIKVKYLTYVSNETMYSQIKSAGVSYDVIIPSDYMIERLKSEDMLQKIDTSKISNYDLIDSKYKGLFFDEKDEYSVPYNVGMVGIVYNEKLTGANIKHSWNVLWDPKYKDMALNFDNPRDAFMTAQMILGQDLNTTNKRIGTPPQSCLKRAKIIFRIMLWTRFSAKWKRAKRQLPPIMRATALP